MKFKNILISIIFLFTIGCGNQMNVESEFQPYYDRFIENGKYYGKDLSSEPIIIKKVDSLTSQTPGTIRLGVCYYKSNIIEINGAAWPSLTEARKEALIAHELGHCLLKREHDNEVESFTGAKLSIMNSYLLYSFEFQQKYPYYTKELFTSPKQKDLDSFKLVNVVAYVSPLLSRTGLTSHCDPEVCPLPDHETHQEELLEDIVID